MDMSESGCLRIQFQEGLTLRESFQLAEKQSVLKRKWFRLELLYIHALTQ